MKEEGEAEEFFQEQGSACADIQRQGWVWMEGAWRSGRDRWKEGRQDAMRQGLDLEVRAGL